jgi:hypothetical protein
MSFCLHIEQCASKLGQVCPKAVSSHWHKRKFDFMLTKLPPKQCRGQKFPQNIELKAMAWAIGFVFQEVQARPKPTPGQHSWPGLYDLAWLGFWPEAKPCTSLSPLSSADAAIMSNMFRRAL